MHNVIKSFEWAESLAKGALHLLDAELGATAQAVPHVFDQVAVGFCLTVRTVKGWKGSV